MSAKIATMFSVKKSLSHAHDQKLKLDECRVLHVFIEQFKLIVIAF